MRLHPNSTVQEGESESDRGNRLAKQHHFKVLRKVGGISSPTTFVVKLDEHRVKRSIELGHHLSSESLIAAGEKKLNEHKHVSHFAREPLLKRTKRDYVEKQEPESDSSKNEDNEGFQSLGFRNFRPHPLESYLQHSYNRQFRNPYSNFRRMMPVYSQNQNYQQKWGRQATNANFQLSDSSLVNKREDPFWNDMWYLNRNARNSNLPDMNVTGAWDAGYSGKGVSVTFLDDGLERDHPDIEQNYDPEASTDINGNDKDPMPRYEHTNENKHGTRCAGEVAAVANNSVCSVGVAFNAGIGGIRMLDGDVTDSSEAASLSLNMDHIDIYSASWGPDDNGEVVDGPGPLAKRAFADGAQLGRKGLGSIFVWASGNGGRFNDSCACDGYANSIYTMSISSTSENSEKPWYLEECSSTLATTYSSGDERRGEHEIITTDIHHKCTQKHTGTSAAAPLAAGIIALALEANPSLTWRDVMYLTVLSSEAKAIRSNNYIMNKRGLLVSSRYGFGLMNAGKMAEFARDWQNIPEMVSCSTQNSKFKSQTVINAHFVEAILNTDACQSSLNEVNYIEQVEIITTIRAPNRGKLEIYLTSPMGTKTLILPRRSRDSSDAGFTDWAFMSVQLWGEYPKGDWILSVASSDGSTVLIKDFQLIVHGTKEKPVDFEKYIDTNTRINNTEPAERRLFSKVVKLNNMKEYERILTAKRFRNFFSSDLDGI